MPQPNEELVAAMRERYERARVRREAQQAAVKRANDRLTRLWELEAEAALRLQRALEGRSPRRWRGSKGGR